MALTKVTDGVLNSAKLNLIVDTSPINAKSYGVVGDGVADDSAALQNAINDAVAAGRDLYIPPGQYNCGATGLTISGPLQIFGSSPNNTQLIRSVNVAVPIIKATSVTGVIVRNLAFDYTALVTVVSGSCNAVYMESCTNVLVDNCHVTKIFYVGITIDSCENATVNNCYVRGVVNRSIYPYRNCQNIIISNNNVDGSVFGGSTPFTDYGININPGTVAPILNNIQGIVVTGNTVENCTTHGISVAERTRNCVISGNVVRNISAFYGILVQEANGGPNLETTVTGNNVSGCGQYGIYVIGSTFITVTGNVSRSNTLDGIHGSLCQQSTFSANIVTNNGGAGILLSGSSARNIVVGNILSNNTGYGLTILDASVFYTRYDDNYVFNNTAGTILDNGVGSSAGTNLTL